jgi:hypothetical protein
MIVQVEDRDGFIRRERLTNGHVRQHALERELIVVRLLNVEA